MRCSRCKRKVLAFFEYPDGTILCINCFEEKYKLKFSVPGYRKKKKEEKDVERTRKAD